MAVSNKELKRRRKSAPSAKCDRPHPDKWMAVNSEGETICMWCFINAIVIGGGHETNETDRPNHRSSRQGA